MNTTATFTPEEFEAKFKTFFEGCQEIVNVHFKTCFPTLTAPTLVVVPGSRYMKINRTDAPDHAGRPGQTSVHVFVDKKNGDVLMAAGWRAPAKHARGNIFDEHNGIAAMTPHGAKYLR